jgi:hypothetical protein
MTRTKKPLPFWLLLILLLAWRYLCHSLMLIPVLWHELKPAPHLPDLLLDHIPLVPAMARWNYLIWILCYIPPAIYLGIRNRDLLWRLVVTDGCLALLRGITIPLTGLGPVYGLDTNALHPFAFWPTWLSIVNPLSAMVGNTAGLYLTKDLYFSGHIATTFLLYLYSLRLGRAAWIFLGLNLLTLATVLLSHLHYSIDIVGAYALTYCVYRASEALAARSKNPVMTPA